MAVNANVVAIRKLADELDRTKDVLRLQHVKSKEDHEADLKDMDDIIEAIKIIKAEAYKNYEEVRKALEAAIDNAAKDRSGETQVPDSLYALERNAKEKYDKIKKISDDADQAYDKYSRDATTNLNEQERLVNDYNKTSTDGIDILKEYSNLLEESRAALGGDGSESLTETEHCDIINNVATVDTSGNSDSNNDEGHDVVNFKEADAGTLFIKELLRSELNDIRCKMPNKNLQNRGNVAIADVNIDGLPNMFLAHSKIHDAKSIGADTAKFSFSPKTRNLQSYVVDGFPRFNDAEAKILENIAPRIKDSNISGKINLYTELPACQSCSNLILEFKRKFPNIKINIFTE